MRDLLVLSARCIRLPCLLSLGGTPTSKCLLPPRGLRFSYIRVRTTTCYIPYFNHTMLQYTPQKSRSHREGVKALMSDPVLIGRQQPGIFWT